MASPATLLKGLCVRACNRLSVYCTHFLLRASAVGCLCHFSIVLYTLLFTNPLDGVLHTCNTDHTVLRCGVMCFFVDTHGLIPTLASPRSCQRRVFAATDAFVKIDLPEAVVAHAKVGSLVQYMLSSHFAPGVHVLGSTHICKTEAYVATHIIVRDTRALGPVMYTMMLS